MAEKKEKRYVSDNAQLMEEWDWAKNNEQGFEPSKLTTGNSKQKVWWKCKKCNQSWFAIIAKRSAGSGCPVCAGQKLVVGVNDLATVNSQLASEWDYQNNELTPQQVSAKSNKRVAWICSACGHKWSAFISARNRGSKCPQCQKSSHSSIPEQIIYFYVKQVFPDTINGYTIKSGNQFKIVDIFIPSINVGIEYDGKQWHKDSAYDISKNRFLYAHGIDFIRIRENGCPILNDNSYCITVDYDSSNYNYLSSALVEIFKFISQKYSIDISVSINIDKDIYAIMSKFENDKKEHSLLYANPSLAEEWDFVKNLKILPQQVNVKSDKKFWWICKKCGYSWNANIYDRNKGVGCPRCAGKVVQEGINDLQSQCPNLLVEWDYEKNNLFPNEISFRSDKKVWWTCQKCGYSWKSRIADRSNGVGCPACAGKVVREGVNDLSTINPLLALEWNYEKNGELRPQMVSGGSNKKVWWICKVCSHTWQRDVWSRNSRSSGCPECARQRRKSSK